MCFLLRFLTSIALFLGFSAPIAFAGWKKVTGIRDIYYRCTLPFELDRPVFHLSEKKFENAFPWNELIEEMEPSALMLHVRIGRPLDPYLGAEFVDLTTQGEKWRVPMMPMTVNRTTAGFLLHPDGENPVEMDGEERALLKASMEFEVFGMKSKDVKNLKKVSPPGPWSDLLDGFRVISNSSKNYAVVLSNYLKSVSICVALPPEESEDAFQKDPGKVEVSPMLSVEEVSRVAFTFFSDWKKLDLLSCADFIGADKKKIKFRD